MLIKCVQCEYFKGVKQIPFEKGLFKYLCFAYPEGIPEMIRSWEMPHTSINKNQEGDFVFKLREEVEEVVEEIVNYQIYDVNGVVGEFISTKKLKAFRDFLLTLKYYPNLKAFIDKGSSLLTEDFVGEVFKLSSPDKEMQNIITIFQDLVDKADTIVTINDGLDDEDAMEEIS